MLHFRRRNGFFTFSSWFWWENISKIKHFFQAFNDTIGQKSQLGLRSFQTAVLAQWQRVALLMLRLRVQIPRTVGDCSFVSVRKIICFGFLRFRISHISFAPWHN
jgi:hypothetical protein